MPDPGMLDIYKQRHGYDRDRLALDNHLKKSKSSKVGGKVAAGLAVTAIGSGIAGAKQSFDKKKAAESALEKTKNAIALTSKGKSRGDASELARRTADANKPKISNVPASAVNPSTPAVKPNVSASAVKPSTPAASASVDKSSSMMDHVRDYGGAIKDTAKRAIDSTIHNPTTRLAVGGTAALVGAGLAARKYLKKNR